MNYFGKEEKFEGSSKTDSRYLMWQGTHVKFLKVYISIVFLGAREIIAGRYSSLHAPTMNRDE